MKRKNLISYLIFTIISICGASSCTSIDEIDDGRIKDADVFSNPKKVAGYLNYCYANLPSRGDVMKNNTLLAAFSDEAFDVMNLQNGIADQWETGRVTAFNNPINIPEHWSNSYEGIRKCNKFLANIDNANTYDEQERESFRAQAHGLRAFYYLNLIKNFGGVPIILKYTAVDFDYSNLKRNTFAECARQIISDCQKVIDVPDSNIRLTWFSGTSDNERSRFSKGMACAIMSEVALYAASPLNNDGTFTWKEASEITKNALKLCLDHGYALFKTKPIDNAALNSYDLYFISKSDVQGIVDTETIMEARNQFSIWSYSGLPIVVGQTKAGACPSQELIDAYETKTGFLPILGYSDNEHLQPIINPLAKGYDEKKPYDNRDPRLDATIYHHNSLFSLSEKTKVDTRPTGNCAPSETSIRNTRTGYYLRKFNNYKSSRSSNFDGYLKIFRLAELYLNYAEALNEASTGSTPQAALDAINEVRSRVDMPKIELGISVDDFRTRIRNERRVEFAFEEHRFFDVRRWKILDQDKVITGIKVIPGVLGRVTYERITIDNNRVANTDKYLRLPIPGNEALKLKSRTGIDFQNTGW